MGAFIVFDVTRQATFDAVKKWKQDLDSKVQLPDGSTIPCMLLANKVRVEMKYLRATMTNAINLPVRPGEAGLLRRLE